MSRFVRALMGGTFILGIMGCGAAPSTPAAAQATGVATPEVEVRESDARAAAHEARGGACPPGFIFDGARCRQQRGIIIDQKGEEEEPRPAPPRPPHAPPPWPLSWLAQLFEHDQGD